MTDVFKIEHTKKNKRIRKKYKRKSNRHSKMRQKSLYDEIYLGTQEYFHSIKKIRRSVVEETKQVQQQIQNEKNFHNNDFRKLKNFSTTLSQELYCKELNFLEDGEDYIDQIHKIVFDGKDNTEYLCLKPWYDDVKFEEIKTFLMSNQQKNKTKILIRELKKQLKKEHYYTPEFPLNTFMYKVESYKNTFLNKKFLSFKPAYMYDYNCDKCGTDSYYNTLGNRKFKRFFTSRRENAWYQCIDSFECDCKESRDLYYEYCEDCFFKLPSTFCVIEKRLLCAFLVKRWEIPDDLLIFICPPILT